MMCPVCDIHKSKVTLTLTHASCSLPLSHIEYAMQCGCGASGTAYQGSQGVPEVRYVWDTSEELKRIAEKWSKTGLLDGLKQSQDNKSMAILLVSPPMQLIPKETPDDMDP